MVSKRLAIITTHPIQYHSPWFKLLAGYKDVMVKVFYTWSQSRNLKKKDPGFGINIEWDIPLLEGYDFTFIENKSSKPGSHHFYGIDNPTLINEIKMWKPDAILIFGWSFKSHLQCIVKFHNKIPILFRGDSTLLNEKPGLRKFLRTIFLRWVYSKVDYALYVGTQNKLYYLRNGLKEKQLKFVPHAIDNNRFSDEKYKNEAILWRKQLGINELDLVFLFAGKLESQKNPLFLLETFSLLKHKNAHLVIVGNGVMENGLKAKALSIPNCHFIDFQNQSKMPLLYNLGDIFILPSRSETWGLSVNEAMACRKPVLVSDKCGCAIDLVKDNVNGYTFKSNDSEDLFSKMNLILLKSGNLTEMGNQSYNIIKNWTFERICNEIQRLVINELI